MEQVHVIRHKVLVDGLSVREVAREMGVSRNTVRRYLEQAAPVRTESEPRKRPVSDEAVPKIHALLDDAPNWTGGKQRLTAARVHDLLRGNGVDVGYTTVKEVVAEWKRKRREVFVPLVYHPGELAEVDFFEVLIDVAGKRIKAWLFVMRLMFSGRDYARVYLRQDQVSFLDAHVHAFEHFGAIPQRIAYDNLKLAVQRILVGGERELTSRFRALASHYLFEACFARPRTGHDKGGVEARGKAIRLQHLVPIPAGGTVDEINAKLIERIDSSLNHVGKSGVSKRELFDQDHKRMLPGPEYRFDACATRIAVASRRSLITIEGAYYSAPCEWAGLDLTVHVGPGTIEIVGPTGTVTHERKRFGERSVDYRHYLRELSKKPQAVRQVAAELVRDLGDPFDRVWRLLVDQHGPRDAARVFAKVLEQIEQRGLMNVAMQLIDALACDGPFLVALPGPSLEAQQELNVDSLPHQLHEIEVATGCAADYDHLLNGGAE